MKQPILLFLLIISIHACTQTSNKAPESGVFLTALKDSLATSLETANKDGEVVGFAVNIINQDQVLYNKSFGYADSKNNRAYQTNTIQNIGSIAKTFLGIALLKAQELGKLNIDDPINKYLPFKVFNPNYPNVPITIRHLATHASSIVDEETNYLRAFILQNDEINEEEEVAFAHFQTSDARTSLSNFLASCLAKEGKWYTKEMYSKNQPGSSFEYSNFGADLCGLVIAQATGMSYAAFTQKYIFAPLEMNSSVWTIRAADSLKRSNFYLFKGQKIADYTAITYPNGGLFTSSEDLAKFLKELMQGFAGKGELLSQSSYEIFYNKQYEQPLNEQGRINHGIFVEYNNNFAGSNELLIGHNGSDFGSFALMYFNPETMVGTILMSNTDIDYKDDIIIPVIKDIWKSILDFKEPLNSNQSL